MLDKNVRLAACHAIDKKLLVDRLLKGYGVPIDTLQAPEYPAFDPSIKVSYDPDFVDEAAGGQRLQPGKARQIHDPDDERLQAEGFRDHPGDRRHVAQGRHRGEYRSLRHRQAFRACASATSSRRPPSTIGAMPIGDPSTSTGFAMFGPSPHCAWKSDDLIAKIGPLWGEAGRGQAHRRLQGGRQIYRRGRLCDPAVPICAADRLRLQRQGDAGPVRRACCRNWCRPA